jgi:prepilin-type N-terminal cleavage/methylation domain-containing protein
VRSGFTLIELLISITIGGLLVGGAIVSYRSVGIKQKVKQAGIGFQTDLKNYQQKALAGQKPNLCSGSDNLIGYRVNYVDSNTYSIKAVCRINNPAAIEVDLPQGVVFFTPFNPSQIFFPVLKSETSGAQTIILSSSNYRYQVVIEPSGVIRGQML